MIGAIVAARFIRHHERALEDEAERALPGPLVKPKVAEHAEGVTRHNAGVTPLNQLPLAATRRALHRSDPQPQLLRPAQEIDADGAVDLVGVERAHEVADARHRLAVEGDDQVARQQPRLRRRPRLVDGEKPRARGLFEAEPAARSGAESRVVAAPTPI